MTAESGPVCASDHCITCGDVAVEVRVVRLLADDMAVVDTGQGDTGQGDTGQGDTAQGTEEVSVALVSVAAGDTILVHAGEAIAVLNRGQESGVIP